MSNCKKNNNNVNMNLHEVLEGSVRNEMDGDDESSASSWSHDHDNENDINRQSVANDPTTASTSSRNSSHNNNNHRDGNNNEYSEDAVRRGKVFIESEEKHVRRVRCTLALVIVVLATLLCTCVFIFTTRSETKSFEQEFMIYTSSIISNVQWESNYNFALMEQLSSQITSNALKANATFPNFTVPYFEIAGGYVNGLSGMIACAYAPFVLNEKRSAWEEYAALNHEGWLDESFFVRDAHPDHLDPLKGTKDDESTHETAFQGDHIHDHHETETIVEGDHHDEEQHRNLQLEMEDKHDHGGFNNHLVGKNKYSNSLYHLVNGSIAPLEDDASQTYAALWQVTPPVPSAINADLFSRTVFVDLYEQMIKTNQTVITTPTSVDPIFDFLFDADHTEKKMEPYSFIAAPVHETFTTGSNTIVGMVVGLTPFENLFDFILPDKAEHVICVITDDCGHNISYEINGPNVSFLGYDDLHDPSYNAYEQTATVEFNKTSKIDACTLKIHVYPSKALENSYKTSKPKIYAFIVGLSLFFMSILIVLYDCTVTRRQEKTMRSAMRNGALIASLFPANVRDRLLEDAETNAEMDTLNDEEDGIKDGKGKRRGFRTRPIADFFPSVTLMFADISGFTAWSSTREPFQVFELLETIYGEFDLLAKRQRIFKVETVGDCYVAASGIPDARDDHAVAMAKFARACLLKMRSLLKKLEVRLGPDTSGLAFRVGLHSGPVTGGVLRGDNARFQLFGDTMNTAARMESTGTPNRIQISQETAQLLLAASKEHWVKQRDEVVHAKGKGEMKTYWLTIDEAQSSTRRSTSSETTDLVDTTSIATLEVKGLDDKAQRLADWNTEMMLRYLKLIVGRRNLNANFVPDDFNDWQDVEQTNTMVVDEVAEIIALPTFTSLPNVDVDSVVIAVEVEQQLHEYVESIARMYRNNPFHNFEHANHVSMSVVKLMARIAPAFRGANKGQEVDDHTCGITSDPLTQFACIFAALIHDVDHHGVPNTQLVRENDPVAQRFHGKSVLEQNSVVIAWTLLTEARFLDLRKTICASKIEVRRFRQLVVNAVMATDIMASDLKAIRECRWNKAFSGNPLIEDRSDTVNRKATIVIDHMIQASDVCHAMQHWHIFRKWNERLFMEMSKAYYDGRADKHPAETWYKGEIGFFDYYIIPLAKKLDSCGVFGVSSDEYLNYAVKNRDEWEARGEEVVAAMLEKAENDPDINTQMKS